MRSRVLIVAGLLVSACEPRITSLGAVLGTPDAGGLEAGLPRRAPAVGALSVASCRKRVGPQLPGLCFGGSGPPPNQCILAITPDGGVALAASYPTNGDRFVRRVHGLDVDRIILEVADSTLRTATELVSIDVNGGAPVVHLTASTTTVFPSVTVRRGAFDALGCEPLDRCSLRDVSLDGGSLTLLSSAPAPTPGAELLRSLQGSRSWATDAGVALFRNASVSVVTSQPGGWAAFDADETLFVTEGTSLLRRPPMGDAQTLTTTLSSPRGVLVIGGYALVVEARAVRAFPKQGGAPLVLYELLPADLGELTAPRLVDGRLVFDQVCQAITATNLVNGNVELDFTLGQSRWLNDEPAFPFVLGARPDAPGFRDVYVTPEVIVGLVE